MGREPCPEPGPAPPKGWGCFHHSRWAPELLCAGPAPAFLLAPAALSVAAGERPVAWGGTPAWGAGTCPMHCLALAGGSRGCPPPLALPVLL